MIQQRKKDYLQRLIEEFFNRLQQLQNNVESDFDERRRIMDECFRFFSEQFTIRQTDNVSVIIEKIKDYDLLEQYAKLLLTRYEIVDIKHIEQLDVALNIVRYIEIADKTFSWDRTILREDILRVLDRDEMNDDIE